MPDLLLELFSEEIPARFQKEAENNLKGLLADAMNKRNMIFDTIAVFSTPRRLVAVVTDLPQTTAAQVEEKRGPRIGSADKAIEGFIKSMKITRDQLFIKSEKRGEFFFARIDKKSEPIAPIISEVVLKLIIDFPWSNSMRWGSESIKWIRPLHSILCILHDENGCEIVPLRIAGMKACNTSCGHRFHSNNKFTVKSFEDYEKKLKKARVILDRNSRKEKIWNEATTLAFIHNMEVVEDKRLLEEITGLVEWPVVLWGEIDSVFFELPSEVLQTSMREHQKFFSVTRKNSKKIQSYISVANIETVDNGHAISLGNDKVLNARLTDALFFWKNDLRNIRRNGYQSFKQNLINMTFHNEIGSEYDRVKRISKIATKIAALIGANKKDVKVAASLCKLDLVSEMVFEFPELQGVMGKYYALESGFPEEVAEACLEHYSPKGPFDSVPENLTSISIALADKIDLITNFWAINLKPTGSKDPYALRRASIGVIRIILERGLDVSLLSLVNLGNEDIDLPDLIKFFKERVRVHFIEKGIQNDIISACFAVSGQDFKILDLYERALAISEFVNTELGRDLVQTYKRANNILTLEERKDGVEYSLDPQLQLMKEEPERTLFNHLMVIDNDIERELKEKNFKEGLRKLALLKSSLDPFFANIKINAKNSIIRRNRLCLLNRIREVMHKIANIAHISED